MNSNRKMCLLRATYNSKDKYIMSLNDVTILVSLRSAELKKKKKITEKKNVCFWH